MEPTVLVCVTVQKECERLILAGKRLADNGNIALRVLHVTQPDAAPLGNPDAQEALNALYALSRKAGAEMTLLYNADVRAAIVDFAHQVNAVCVVVGSSREDGIGPKEGRKRMVNTHWGGVVEDNSFGTHEYLELCRQIGCDPYINANVGSGTVREMSEWIEYVNSDGDSTVVRRRWANGRKDAWAVKYWGIGNESWGCGGNMRPEYYADEFRRYQTYCRQYGDKRPFRIACGPNSGDYEWTRVLMERAGRFMDGLSLHNYTVCGDT